MEADMFTWTGNDRIKPGTLLSARCQLRRLDFAELLDFL
jgi:hypothetical protein